VKVRWNKKYIFKSIKHNNYFYFLFSLQETKIFAFILFLPLQSPGHAIAKAGGEKNPKAK
jgi:hypothetical protein